MILWLVPIAFIAVWIIFGITEGEWLFGFIPALLGVLVALCIIAFTCGMVETCADIDYKVSETCEISALVDNARFSHTVSGSVFLIQTRTDSTLKYSYMYYEDGRGYAFEEVNADSCYINYTNESPRLEIYEPYFTNKIISWLFGYPIFTGWDYVFYLPQDAEVIDSFVIDFE
jgi:hypothetical protein